MRPRERQETGEQDLFRSRLDQIIDLSHALVKLSRAIGWRFLEAQCGSVYSDGPGCPPLPTRLKAGLALLHRLVGTSLLYTGYAAQGRVHFDQSIALYHPAEHRPLATRFGQDVRVASYNKQADQRSWIAMQDFFKEIFA